MFFGIGLTMALLQGGYVRKLPENKTKPTAVLVTYEQLINHILFLR